MLAILSVRYTSIANNSKISENNKGNFLIILHFHHILVLEWGLIFISIIKPKR